MAAVAAAPLAAASPTYTYRVDFAAGVARPIGANVPAGVPTIPVTITAPPNTTRTATQLTVHQADTVTVQIGRSVTNLTFAVSDITGPDNNDNLRGQEYVTFTPAPSTVADSGAATGTNPITVPTQNGTGSTAVTYAGPTSRVDVGVRANGIAPSVVISGMTFTVDLRQY
ncbi:hypothetical protein E4A47_01225 [Micrococcus flavus]|uniref:Uncharacterized protein n=1 Tax=Micrococcus flavus TaxID=384602 RepID=A0A4Y8X3P8_9MICC|nr:hypothetical protein [Micrococcus flavus]MBB4882865.1 hypothetical protein [Micrococcus flavus]TFI04303.1 hypothetical protein E4A47_01225 [Micrococcus flavus]